MKKLLLFLILAVAIIPQIGLSQPPAYPPGMWIMSDGALRPIGNIAINPYWLSGDGDGEGIYIDTNGDVGVGTDSPDAPLSVVGGVSEDIFHAESGDGDSIAVSEVGSEIAIIFNGSASKRIRDTKTALEFAYQAGLNDDIVFRASGDALFKLDDGTVKVTFDLDTGRVGIGTEEPATQFHITGGLTLGTESVTCGDGTNTCSYSAAYTASYYTTDDDADGADVVTVSDGVGTEQIRRFVLKTDGGDDLAITPTNFANGTTVTLDTAGESVTLGFDGANWYIISHYGGVVS